MLIVSNYHYIREDFAAPFPSIFGLQPDAFEKQLLLLQKAGTFVHPADLLENTTHILTSEENYILVTFDDGLREQFELAKPILDRLNIPALYFINSVNHTEKEVTLVHKIHLLRSQIAPSELLGAFASVNPELNTELTASEIEKAITHYNYDDRESACLKYILNFKLSLVEQSVLTESLFKNYFDETQVNAELYMTEAQLKILAQNGMLGSHTHSHLALGLLEPKAIADELSKTKTYLEQLTNTEIRYVSYPFGSAEACVAPVPEIAADLGYTIGFSMERGANTGKENRLLLKRFDCNDLPSGKNEILFKDEYSFLYK